MLKKILAVLFSILAVSSSIAQSQALNPQIARYFFGAKELQFDGKRMVSSGRPVPEGFDNTKKVANWSRVDEKTQKKILGAVHWDQEADAIWLSEVTEFLGGETGSGVQARVTTFVDNVVMHTTFCNGVVRLDEKEYPSAVQCVTASRKTCDALIGSFGTEFSKEGMVSPQDLMDGTNKCRDEKNFKSQKCATLIAGFKNMIVLLKQEAAKDKKNIEADLKRIQSELENGISKKWQRTIKIENVMSAEYLDKIDKSFKHFIHYAAYMNRALLYCHTNHPFITKKAEPTSAGPGSSGAPAQSVPGSGAH